jgi:hypothetical protein
VTLLVGGLSRSRIQMNAADTFDYESQEVWLEPFCFRADNITCKYQALRSLKSKSPFAWNAVIYHRDLAAL